MFLPQCTRLRLVPRSDAMPADVEAYVFDAYGTLFDVFSVTGLAERLAPGHGADLSKLWRAKQLEYTWLGSMMQQRRDFQVVTEQALDYAVSALVLPLDSDARKQLMDAWLELRPYPDALETLERLAPCARWVLSNGTRAMLDPLIDRSGLGAQLDGVLSVDEAGVYKPSPKVYALATKRLGLPAERIGFVSANGWDAVGAKAFGLTVWWINRAGLPIDRHGPAPDFTIGELGEVGRH